MPAVQEGHVLHNQRIFAQTLLFFFFSAMFSTGFFLINISGVQAYIVPARTPHLAGCQMFPADSIWNYNISNLPVYPNSSNYIASMGAAGQLHADFGAPVAGYAPQGIGYAIVNSSQPAVPVQFYYAQQSDPGPYPIPANAPIENGPNSQFDRHVLVLNNSACQLYELWNAYPQPGGSWLAGSGATWSLNSDALRPLYWTSADAAGLPILPGLVRYDEIASGSIDHALRVVANATQMAFLWPARHFASSSTNPNLPPMGLRLRLKASFNISPFPQDVQVILTALKNYGMFVADNQGVTSWVVTGAPDPHWNNFDLNSLGQVHGSDFEAVDESMLQASPDSARVNVRALPHTLAAPVRPLKTFSPHRASAFDNLIDKRSVEI
jgi:hypothetical protein